MVFRKLRSLVLVLAVAGSAGAYTLNDIVVEYWAGSGSNEAVVVIDFGQDSYAFGYRWDIGPKYGKDLMDAVAAAGVLNYTETWSFVNTISYRGYPNIGQGGYPTDWWSYFTSTDGGNWIVAGEGYATRELSDGAWDGWAHQIIDWPPVHLPTTPTDFAAEVIEYVEGSGVGKDWISGQPYNDPNTALGRPTLETTGDGWDIPLDQNVPVVPVYTPFRAFEVVTIGNGGHLTVKFNHRIADDENNPYGIDFIVFGNASQIIGAGQAWKNGNPEETTLGGSVLAEPGIVSVSQDGQMWHTFLNGPYADDFAPTASYEWDEVEDKWTEELDPTRPVDPNLRASDFGGKTLAEMIRAYNGSAGGTGFDLQKLPPSDYARIAIDPNTGCRWIQYVRIEDNPGSSATTEIDAIADVSCCGDYRHPYPAGDLNKDCRVDFSDIAVIALHWLDCTWECDRQIKKDAK
jgi:hypothetical protein